MKFALTFAIILLLGSGCSKKQSEVDELEKELLGQQDTVDTFETTAPAEGETAGQTSAEAVSDEETSYEPTQVSGDGYTVQVAGCESLDYAQHLVELYTDRGYEPYITEYETDGQLYYRVRIGQFEGFSEASTLKSELEDKYSLTAWVDNL